jgi:type IV secretory pathway VirB4 component
MSPATPAPAAPPSGGIVPPGPQANYGGPAVAPPSFQASAPAQLQTPAAVSKSNPNSTQNTLEIAEIRDGLAIMNDGSFRAVIMCKSINFDLMSPQEREAIEYSYQGFLNSLYFPVQVFMRSQKVDMRPYLEKLDKIKSEQDNMLLALLMEDYIVFLADIVQQTNIMDKNFYVIIEYPDPDEEDIKSAVKTSTSFFTGMIGLIGGGDAKTPHVVINEADLEKAKTELRNRVQAAMQGLQECGVQSLPLDTQELIELYYDAYNPDTATRQHLAAFDSLGTPVVTKGVGDAPQPDLDRSLI